jgi:DNA-binding transcriptional ArsR family regulator
MTPFTDLSPVELATVASLLSDTARAAMLVALLDGKARTAGELAFVAGISPQTASSHLAKLVEAGLVAMKPQGRHRYHRLAGPETAQALEALSVIAGAMPRRPRIPGPRDLKLREGRTCYDHFAGRLGVAIADALVRVGGATDNGRDFAISGEGERRLARLGVDVPALRRERRPLCRYCIDWSERRPHLSGAVGASLATRCLAAGWVERLGDTRGVRLTGPGRAMLRDALGLDLDWLAAA